MVTTNEKGDTARLTARTPGQFPHVNIRVVNGDPEPYIPDTGLAVWEIAWLARAHGGDAEAITRHTLADRELVEEGLRYAAEHAIEIDAQIVRHTERSLDELLELLPGMRVFTFDADGPDN